MKTNRVALSLPIILVAIAGCMAPGDSRAVNLNRTFFQNAAGPCQAALPAFEGQIRKRPLALQNEGTSPAFVSCAFSYVKGVSGTGNAIKLVRITASSIDGAEHAISCTGVTGGNMGTNQYKVVTATLPASGASTALTWIPQDFISNPAAFFPSPLFSASCNLAPGVSLNVTSVEYEEEVGA